MYKSMHKCMSEKTIFFICRHSSQRTMIYCVDQQEVGQLYNMLKSRHFNYHAYFFRKEYLIRYEGSTKYILYMLLFSVYSDTTWKLKV